MFFLVLAAMASGFVMAIPRSAAASLVVVILFAYMTFISALDISFKDFLRILKKPWNAVLILILVHFAMPVVAWGIGTIIYPQDTYITMGFLIQSAIPIAVTSLIWISIVGGDMALAIVALTLDTLISPFLLPLFFLVVAGEAIQINYVNMFWQLVIMVTLPSIAGMIIHDLTNHRLARFTSSVGGLLSKLAIFFLIALNVGGIVPALHWDLGLLKLLVVLGTLVACGFVLAFAVTFLLPQPDRPTIVSMVYTVGMRNIVFGSVLALAYFPAQVAVPVTLASLFQHPLAAIVAQIVRKITAKQAPAKTKTEEDFT